MPVEYLSEMVPRLIAATGTTILLLGLSALCGLVIAVPMSLARLARNATLQGLSNAYVFVFRGTPALVQLYFIYYGFAQLEMVRESVLWTVFEDAYWCGLIALSLNTGAYTTEIFRGALMAVPRDYVEAGRALGLTERRMFWLIRLPTAFRLGLPAYGNELILLTKATSIVSTITILDLMGTAKLLYTETFDPFAPLLTAAALYLVLIYLMTRAIAALEYFMFPHLRDELKLIGKARAPAAATADMAH
jgi:His/Glu/Gln/Arg/opine family amino acid ABC transporter permease subunit